jgi:hypothetical protein
MRWELPSDRPEVEQDVDEDTSVGTAASNDCIGPGNEYMGFADPYHEHNSLPELDQLNEVIEWLHSEDKQLPKMPCVLLENVVAGLIRGGRYLYLLGADALPGCGAPDLEYLTECSINCAVVKFQQKAKGSLVDITLKATADYNHLGFDEEQLTCPPRTIGPRQSGPPADIWLLASPSWILDLTPLQREAAIYNALYNIRPHEGRYLNPWQIAAADLSGLNAATIEAYGAEAGEVAKLAIHSGARHANLQMILPTMAERDKMALLERFSEEMGIQLTRDGRAVNPDGTYVEYAEDNE